MLKQKYVIPFRHRFLCSLGKRMDTKTEKDCSRTLPFLFSINATAMCQFAHWGFIMFTVDMC